MRTKMMRQSRRSQIPSLWPSAVCLIATVLIVKASAYDQKNSSYAKNHLAVPCTTKASKNEIFFNVDLLVWDAREDGLEYAYKNSGTQNNQELSSFEPHSKFEPAFRLGLGGFLPYDSWTLGAIYTFYRTERHSSGEFNFNPYGTPGPGMIAVWTYPSAFSNNNNGARFSSAKNTWRLHSSFLDLELGRPCKIASYFTLTPSFGIRSAWLHQRYQVEYANGNLILFGDGDRVAILSSGIDMYTSSNNLGLLFGCGFKWLLGKHWDLFTDLSGSFLASRFDVKRKEIDLFWNLAGILETQSIQLKSEYWSFRPQGQIALGFRFSDDFFYGTRLVRYHFTAAYEAQMWWKQNQLLRYIDVQNDFSSGANTTPMQGDLMFHGVDLEAGFDF
jgi:hypothetical protein